MSNMVPDWRADSRHARTMPERSSFSHRTQRTIRIENGLVPAGCMCLGKDLSQGSVCPREPKSIALGQRYLRQHAGTAEQQSISHFSEGQAEGERRRWQPARAIEGSAKLTTEIHISKR